MSGDKVKHAGKPHYHDIKASDSVTAPAPHILAGLPPEALKAVNECHESIGRHTYMQPPDLPPPEAVPVSKRDKKFMDKVKQIENVSAPSLYTNQNYETQLERAKEYTDTFVAQLKFPERADAQQQKAALKEKFHAIIDGAAGMETGWSPDKVRGSAARPHTGVYQTQWSYINEARKVYDHIPAMKEALGAHPDDRAVLELAKHTPKGAPTTSFAGQGAAFAGMAVQSYQDFIDRGGRPETFNGVVVYQEHLLGKSGAEKFREALAEEPEKKGHPGVGKPTYYGNYLTTKAPFAGVNDLNPDRLVYSTATPHAVDHMLRDKFIFAYLVREKEGASAEKLKGFQDAFLPEWSDPARRQSDIEQVRANKELGSQMRESPLIREDVCTVLMPMQAFSALPKTPGQAK